MMGSIPLASYVREGASAMLSCTPEAVFLARYRGAKTQKSRRMAGIRKPLTIPDLRHQLVAGVVETTSSNPVQAGGPALAVWRETFQ